MTLVSVTYQMCLVYCRKARVCIRTYVRTYVRTCVRAYVRTCVRTYVRIGIVRTYVRMGVVHTCVRSYVRRMLQVKAECWCKIIPPV